MHYIHALNKLLHRTKSEINIYVWLRITVEVLMIFSLLMSFLTIIYTPVLYVCVHLSIYVHINVTKSNVAGKWKTF